jgi:hypothetical protein
MPGAITIAVFALAVARVTRFITADKLSETIRHRIVWKLWLRSCKGDAEWARLKISNKAPEPLLAYLLTCPWCASIYVAAVAAPVCWLWGDSPYTFVPALGLAFSQVTGLLAMIGD